MKVFSHLFNTLPKRLAATAMIALAVFLPAATLAASTVKIQASTTVANASKDAGSMNWNKSTSASYNQVVAVQVVYDNTEKAGSGKAANDLRVKINIPSKPGKTQTVTSKVSSNNSNTVNGSATVKLNRSDAYLQYIPGSATWKHAKTNNGPRVITQKVSDAVVTSSNGLRLENELPCRAGSIVVEARVMVPGVQVTKKVRNLTKGATWSTSNTAKPGETLQYEIEYQNTGNTKQNKVIIRDNLPKGASLVPKTTYLYNQTNPKGILSKSDTLAQGGLYVGNYAPTANAFVIFKVKMPSADKLKCGTNTLTNIGVAQPKGMEEYWNSAKTTINKKCQSKPGQPTYACDAFHVDKLANRTVKVDKFQHSQSNGATFKDLVIDWGDQSTPLTTNKAVGQTYQYAKDGTYTITATAHFTVNGKDVSDSGDCTQTVTFTTPGTTTTPPQQLVNTGAGSTIGIFAIVATLGAFAHRLFLSRKLARD